MSPSTDPLFRMLHTIRRRILLQIFVKRSLRFALYCGALLIVTGALRHWVFQIVPYDHGLGGGAVMVAFSFAALSSALRRLSLRQVAQHVDRLGKTNDRVLTAFTLAESGPADGMPTLALRECRAFLEKRDFLTLFPVRVPKEALWIIAPVVCLALLQWDARNAFDQRTAETVAAQGEVAPTVAALEQLAHVAETKSKLTDDETLKRLAEKLRATARDLRANVTQPQQAAKASLKELSALEEFVKALQKTPAQIGAEELAQLAKALEKNDATKEAAEAIQKGNLADAAKALEKAAKEGGLSAGKAEEELQRALDQMATQRKISEALEQLAAQMQNSPAGEKSGLQKLAQLLQQMARGKSGAQSSQKPKPGQSSEQNLKNLLAALQSLKNGEGKPGGNQPQQAGNGDGGKVAMEVFGAKRGEGESPIPGQPTAPSGRPGSERDSGTTATPFGEETGKDVTKGAALELKGQLGEGDSLSIAMPAVGDQSKAARRYKELYEALAPAAQDAVVQEEIPLGSRYYIKRYFESIRPE